MMSGVIRTFALGLVSALTARCSPAMAAADTIRIGGTTSVRESGLLSALEAGFHRDTGDQLQFIVGGTGRVLKLLEAQDVSGALVHDTDSEQALLDAGGTAERFGVMRNDFIILGPSQRGAHGRDRPVPRHRGRGDALSRAAITAVPPRRAAHLGRYRDRCRRPRSAHVVPQIRLWAGGNAQHCGQPRRVCFGGRGNVDRLRQQGQPGAQGLRASLRNVYGVLLGYDGDDVDGGEALPVAAGAGTGGNRGL